MAEGDAIELFDGCGLVAEGRLEARGSAVSVRVTAVHRVERTEPAVDLAVALPKGPRCDQMVQQLTQVGVDRLIPLRTRYSVVDPRAAKLERLRQIVVEATKQCGRAYLMGIDEPIDLTAVGAETYDLRLFAQPGSAADVDLDGALRAAQRVLILIGPEGGWADEELRWADAAGCQRWSLGAHVLRIETAAAAVGAIVGYHKQRLLLHSSRKDVET